MGDYLEFFGFRDDPFKITPDSHYFFLSESHQEALSSLKYLYETEEGFAVIIGEPGTGKTLTIRKFIDELPPNEVRFAYILFPNLTPEELFEAILEDFGIKSEGETKNRLFAKLRDFLIKEREEGRKVLIIIDEAQNLPVETIEELRILSNLETADRKLLQIILLGQPELEEMLNSRKLRQLRQRITVMVKLRNLSEKETRSYIDYRIARAGGGNVRINQRTYRMVYNLSLGIPRLINILMERALMAAFVEGIHDIKPEHVERAAESVGLRVEKKRLSKPILTFSVLGLFFAGTLLFLGFNIDKITLNKELSEVSRVVKSINPEKITGDGRSSKAAYVEVIVPMLNMRESPDTSSDVIYVLQEGDKLEVLERGPGTWIKARYKRNDIEIEGWVNGKYVTSIYR